MLYPTISMLMLALLNFTTPFFYINVAYGLPLPRNVSAHQNDHKANVNVHNAYASPSFDKHAVLHLSLGDRHRRDLEPEFRIEPDQTQSVSNEYDFDNDIDGPFDTEVESELDFTQPAMDDELLRFNNALEQALDYITEMDSSVIPELDLDNTRHAMEF